MVCSWGSCLKIPQHRGRREDSAHVPSGYSRGVGPSGRRPRAGCAGAWRGGNRALLACVALVGVVTGHAAQAQAAPTPVAAPEAPSALPAPADCLAAFAALDGWVRSGVTPDTPSPIDPSGATGVSVTLRLGGRIVGRATVMAGDANEGPSGGASGGAPGGASEDTAPEGETLWSAARLAIADARERIPGERDATREADLREAFTRVAIDAQFGGRLTPLLGETVDDAAIAVNPGVEGVAVRVGARLRAHMPGLMLSTNTTPAQSLTALCADLDVPRLALGALRAEHGVTAYRFPAQHLAQPAPGEPARFLFRGGRVVGDSEVSAAALRALADRIATHLLARAWPTGRGGADEARSKGLLGDYLPWLDRHEPLIAPPAQQALAAYALMRRSKTEGVSPKTASGSDALARRIIRDMESAAGEDGATLMDAGASGMFVLAALAAGEGDPGEALASATARAAAMKVSDSFGDQGWDESLTPPARAVIAAALVQLSRLTKQGDAMWISPDRAAEATLALYRDTPEGRLVGLMPWLGWAALELCAPPADLPVAPALIDMRETLWRHQLVPEDVMPDSPDLVGGIVFTSGRTPLPTWQTARPIAFVATMLADPRLTPRDQATAQLASLSRSLRFLMQLTADEATGHMEVDRGRSLGGVRESLWNQRMPVDASAMTLLAVCEALRAVDALGAARR